MPNNSEKLTALLSQLVDRRIITNDQKNKLSTKLSASYENIEFLMDLITGNVPSMDTALNILFRLN